MTQGDGCITPSTVLLLDNTVLLRQGLTRMLAELQPAPRVFEAGTLEEAMRILVQHPVDLITVEPLCTPRPAEAVARLAAAAPDTPIVVLTSDRTLDELIDLMGGPIRGYLHKATSFEVLLTAVREVCRGGLFVDPALALSLIQSVRQKTSPESRQMRDGLTPREREVLTMASQGRSNREIAQALGLSASTVKAHFRSLFAKLSVSDRTQAILKASRAGLLPGGTE